MEVLAGPHSPDLEELMTGDASQTGSDDRHSSEVISAPKCPVEGTAAGETLVAGEMKRKDDEVEAAAAPQILQKRRKQGSPLVKRLTTLKRTIVWG